jgi:hypothetical protein
MMATCVRARSTSGTSDTNTSTVSTTARIDDARAMLLATPAPYCARPFQFVTPDVKRLEVRARVCMYFFV